MNKQDILKHLDFIDKYSKGTTNAATSSEVDSNANVSTRNIATLQTELFKKDMIALNRALTYRYLEKENSKELADQYINDLNNHIIYRHNETSLESYCASISLYPFIMKGLKDVGGSASAPTHADSFIGGLCNLIFLVAGQFVGAISTPEFLTYLDHFIRKDYGDDYISNLDKTITLFGTRELTLRKKIEDWFQQFVYTINQPASARNYQSPFTNIAYFDEYYFKSIFKDFVFPDGDEPKWETTKELQKLFMEWFNIERTKTILTFPVESFSLLVDKETGEYKDKESADFVAHMWAKGHSFFMYQNDSVDSLSSCCRLKNELDSDGNEFSYTLGAGGVETGSKCVITLNLNRIIQNWDKEGRKQTLIDYLNPIVKRVHKYLNAWNDKLWDDYNNNILTVYKAGFINLNKQYLTIGVNSLLEASEYLSITDKNKPEDDRHYSNLEIKADNEDYKRLVKDILGTIKQINKEDKTKTTKYNCELVPAENAGYKLYTWDKEDDYWVPKQRNLYNSYFYPVEDNTYSVVDKFYLQGKDFTAYLDGGAAYHCNLDSFLTEKQYRFLMNIAVKAGCNYFTYNIPSTVCEDCGYINKNYVDHCTKCNSEKVNYATRVIGYLRLVSNFSEARQIEASKRAYDNYNDD